MIYKILVDSITDICYTDIRKEENMTEAKRKASAKYDKFNTKIFAIKLNKNTDADLIRLLESQDNIQGYIKECLRRAL